MKKILISAAVVIAAVAGVTCYNHESEVEMSDMAKANVRALADNKPDHPQWDCDSYSCVIYCQIVCPSCGMLYRASDGYGHSTDAKGECKCGYHFHPLLPIL